MKYTLFLMISIALMCSTFAETEPVCGGNETLADCAKPAWCNTCEIRGNCKLQIPCPSGCDCKPGFYRDSDERCIDQLECPTDISDCPKIRCASYCHTGTDDRGCPTCVCKSTPPVCPKIRCALYCHTETDDRGCPRCVCNSTPPAQ